MNVYLNINAFKNRNVYLRILCMQCFELWKCLCSNINSFQMELYTNLQMEKNSVENQHMKNKKDNKRIC